MSVRLLFLPIALIAVSLPASAQVSDCCSNHFESGCDDDECETLVCEFNPLCCIFSWTSDCAQLATQICDGLCAKQCGFSGPCCEPHGEPFCNGASCCATVCSFDPFCCDFEWDAGCVDQAFESCGGGCQIVSKNTCFIMSAHGIRRRGCALLACEAQVCSLDPYCCQYEWDKLCVELAIASCPELTHPACGPGAGPCCDDHGTPGCSMLTCCEAVCALDPFCCDIAWDKLCVDGAELSLACSPGKGGCFNVPVKGHCCVPNDSAGCDDVPCEFTICQLDPFCCDQGWDEMCAELARAECIEICQPPLACVGDINASWEVDSKDLNILLGAFGSSLAGDLDGSGATDSVDLNLLLAQFGVDCQ